MAAQTPHATSHISLLLHGEDDGDELFDGLWRKPGKKQRLAAEQVQSLEKSFEAKNKLEPERKIKLAEELGLQPRQVAIWFQNRRARYKTKQLEKDYSSLKTLYENLKSENQNLVEEQDKLKTEVGDLKQKLAIREKGKRNSWITEGGFDSEKQSSMADSYHGFEDEEQEDDELRRNWVWSCDFDDLDSNCCNVVGFQIEDGDQALGFWPY